MTRLLAGKHIADQIIAECSIAAEKLREQAGVVPGLTFLLAGDNPASLTYVMRKKAACVRSGIKSGLVRLGQDATTETLLDKIAALNEDPSCHGMLVQLPLPDGIDAATVLGAIDPVKDVDGLHPCNLGLLAAGRRGQPVACTPQGCMRLLREAKIDPAGKRVAMIGRSLIVGRPMAFMLLNANATVTVCHSATRDLAEETRRADILIVAAGRHKIVTGDMVKPGAAVIDVGINRAADGKIAGDVDFASVREVAGAISPVPGGVGPLTVAMLMRNTVEATIRQTKARRQS